MGCDIHLHIEIKINGEWEHYACPNVDRSYALFTLMAGVRNHGGIEPIDEPRGMPADASAVTLFCHDEEYQDSHSWSWLGADDLIVLEDRWQAYHHRPGMSVWEYDLEGNVFRTHLFGNSFAGFARYPDERPKGLQDVRLVFWFDN